MLAAYRTEKDCLIEHPATLDPAVLSSAVWLDLVSPTPAEEKAVELALGIDIPTRGELEEIEASSRLYQENGAAFMTANLIRRGEEDRPEASAVTFIIHNNRLVTVRYHHPQAFPVYVKQAMKPQATAMTGWGVMISLLEAVIDRAADHLERVGAIVDDTSRQVFDTSFVRKRRDAARRRKKPKNLEELLGKVGEEGDFTSKMRESLVSIGRMVAYMQAILEQTQIVKSKTKDVATAKVTRVKTESKETQENKARLKVVQRDIQSLSEHAGYLTGKISFLLDAVLGMISIEQNGIIKIFSIASVIFLPPTLVASMYGMNFKVMPELDWAFGYPYAIGLMIISAVVPIWYFRHRGWL
ncbi:MAG: magnesium transporter CorA family protein [Alphaproteobacteria bacterium]|nr:magnesium transporter CorA family protein [Alphaproteobacteria bacterium]